MGGERKLLVVNADDLGMCRAVNGGIARCVDAGAVTQASLMLPCPEAREGIRLASDRSLPLAIHLTLTCEWDRYRWNPLTQGATLVTDDGAFLARVDTLRATADPSEVIAELQAQVEAFLEAGLRPVALDSHQQLYDEHMMASLVVRYAVRSRDPLPSYSGHALPYSSVFRMSPLHPDLKLHVLLNYVRSVGPGVHLVICHPAEDDPKLSRLCSSESSRWQRAWARSVRVSDLESLLDPRFVETCGEAGVKLVSLDAVPLSVPEP